MKREEKKGGQETKGFGTKQMNQECINVLRRGGGRVKKATRICPHLAGVSDRGAFQPSALLWKQVSRDAKHSVMQFVCVCYEKQLRH